MTHTLVTAWSAQMDPTSPLPEYPRPQMVRPEWLNLNGPWQYAIRPRRQGRPSGWDGTITVPFPLESQLSGVCARLEPSERLWYRRDFAVPGAWFAGEPGRRLLLHLGADWETTVWCNGVQVGLHRGGYTPFTLDVTDTVRSGDNELVVAVHDPTSAGRQPRGKQTLHPKRLFYTAVSGIWQTVWIEPVPAVSVHRLRLASDLERGALGVTVDAGGERVAVEIQVFDGDTRMARARGTSGTPVWIDIPGARCWSPEDPHLYDFTVALRGDANDGGDRVRSYAGLRTVAMATDVNGILRLHLNGKPVFHLGVLDQGWWPDGLYTAPCDAALRSDLETIKSLGFNTVRKHLKVEPARWYHHCDRIGLLAWQDIPNGGVVPGKWGRSRRQFATEVEEIVTSLDAVPSVVVWVPFNEAWGQWGTARVTDQIRRLDRTRLVDSASGWIRRGVGDIRSNHRYIGLGHLRPDGRQALVCSEFGGFGRVVPGHLWQEQKNWSYRPAPGEGGLTSRYLAILGKVRARIPAGLTGAIYTQLTDVETEVNGLLTYDRAVVKVDAGQIAACNRSVIDEAASCS